MNISRRVVMRSAWLLLAPFALLMLNGCENLADTTGPAAGTATPPSTESVNGVPGGGFGAITAVVQIALPTPEGTPPEGSSFIINDQGTVIAVVPPPGSVDTPTPTPTATPDIALLSRMLANERIVLVSGRDGNREIYVVNADGGQPTRLTSNTADDIDPAPASDGWHIAFASDRDGDYEIFLTDAVGSSPIRLTDNTAVDRFPAWSPDGHHIAFTSNRDGNFEIYVMSVPGPAAPADAEDAAQVSDGGRVLRLTEEAALDRYPTWSPDGQYIAFESNRNGNPEIYVMRNDGSQPVRLTQDPAQDSHPSWSPDGAYIAFESDRDGNPEIYVLSVEDLLSRGETGDSRAVRLTENPAWDYHPAWSPDGRRFAFVSTRDDSVHIYTMQADGSRQTRLTLDTTAAEAPAWTSASAITPTPTPTAMPATGKILFVSDRDGNTEIYVMNVEEAFQGASGSQPTRLTHNTADDHSPAWSPDGQRIVFVSNRDGNNEIYVMNPDGSQQTRLTRSGDYIDDIEPAWAPDGRRIVFTSFRDQRYEIYIMNVEDALQDTDGSQPTRLTYEVGIVSRFPAWSSDGERLAFASISSGGDAIYAMNADGSELVRLTSPASSAFDRFPTWSPNGRFVAFEHSSVDAGIYVMRTDGSQQTRLTEYRAWSFDPGIVWAADGRRLAFVLESGHVHDVHVVNIECISLPEGCRPTNLTNAPGNDWDPSWSPDGRYLALVSDRDGNGEIYVMYADGRYPLRLTHHAANDFSPAWSPK